MAKRKALFQCLECGRKYYSTASAQNAMDHGCSSCGGSNIDIYLPPTPDTALPVQYKRGRSVLFKTV